MTIRRKLLLTAIPNGVVLLCIIGGVVKVTVETRYIVDAPIFLGAIIALFLLSTSFMLLVLCATTIVTSLGKLAAGIEKFEKGELERRIDLGVENELADVATAFNNMAAELKLTTVSRDFMDNILHSMTDMLIVFDPDWEIRSVNNKTIITLGYSETELMKQKCADIFEDAEPIYRCKDQCMLGCAENVMFAKDARRISVLCSVSALYANDGTVEGYVCVASDITERRQAEAEIRRFKEILESTSDLVSCVTPDKKIFYMNQAGRKMLGWDDSPLGELQIRDVHPQWAYEKIAREGIPMAVEMGVWVGETALRTADGREIPMSQVILVHKSPTGEPDYLSTVMRDISEQKKLEKQLRESIHQIEKAHQELKNTTAQLVHGERLRALGELAAGVAHELKQPLNVIKLVSQMVLIDKKKGRFKEEQLDESLGDVVSQVDRMAEIIDHMRIFTRRADQGVMQALPVNDRVESACKFFSQQLKNHGIEFMKELASDLPMIKCDPIRIEQVIMNFVSNARKALEESKKENKKIVIRTYRTSNSAGKDAVAIEVRDNANGVPEEIVAKIFEPFFTTAEPGKGTGLGLSICCKIIEEHGGTIEIDNKVGEGAAFRAVLPAIVDASKAA